MSTEQSVPCSRLIFRSIGVCSVQLDVLLGLFDFVDVEVVALIYSFST